jgi:hypothetical protein
MALAIRYTRLVISSLCVCMAIIYIIVLFVETPRKNIVAVINLRGVSTNKTIKTRNVSLFVSQMIRSREEKKYIFQV